MIKVAVSGIHYPLSMMKYFIRALQRRDDVELVTVGPFTGNKIPWSGGLTISQKYVETPKIALPERSIGQRVNYALIAPQMPWKPDLWLQVDAGWHFADRPDANIVALVKTDPHAIQAEFYQQAKNYSDFTFNMQTPYMQPNETYLPYAYDPTVHFPMEIEKVYDACLIGLHYRQRDNLINRLRAQGLNVYYNLGDVFDEYRLRFNQSRVGLNWSSMQDLNARVFELAAMRICPIQNTVPDMRTFFVPGDHYLEFHNTDQAQRQVTAALADEDMRQEIADAAYRKVKPHTYDNRISQILETCKII